MATRWENFTKNLHLHRVVVLLIIIGVLYAARGMMNTILLTFIFTYLIVHWVRLVQRWWPRAKISLVVVGTYALIIGSLYFVLTDYVPLLVTQVGKMAESLVTLYRSPDMKWLMGAVNHYLPDGALMTQAKHGVTIAVNTLTTVGTLTAAVVFSLILSFFYTIELNRMNRFSRLFLTADRFGWFFQDVSYFGHKFVNTFGVVLEAQFFIALTNTALTLLGLVLMHFPQIFALGLLVFVLSLVPVAGAIISLIPLSMVGYTVGGWRDVIYVLIMILIIHALESYVLNPKLMSSRTELPIFYTFVVLLVAEHLFAVWGLIVGVPIFTFLLDILGVKQIGHAPASKADN